MAMEQLDRGSIRHNLEGFVTRWRDKLDALDPAELGRSEKSHAQTFWGDLLRQFGVIPEQANLFEREAERATTGNRGYIDVFWSSVFIGEAKSVGKDLAAAEDQALDYLAGGSIGRHEWPRFVLCTDFRSFRLTRLGDESARSEFALDDLVDHVDELMFLAGQETVTRAEEEEASIEASKIMAGLYTAMVGDDADEPVGDEAPRTREEEDEATQAASMFLTRVLFLLYGDDAGLWEADLFYRFVLYDTTSDNLGGQLRDLFDVLNTPENRRRHVPESLARFPYVNGALFADPMPVQFFTPAMREALLAACRFRWTRISPAVFGSMFQMVKSRQARRAAGEHYTTETNILKTIGPLFLDEFQAQADRLCRNSSTTQQALAEFRDSLSAHVFVDPACGSGNFLTLAYGRLRDIETQVIVELRKRRGQTSAATLDATLNTRVTIDQFHGIEINWWPAKIAETAMFLADHEANRRLARAVGAAPDRLPITITAHIHHINALAADWTALISEPRTIELRPQVNTPQGTLQTPAVTYTGTTYIFGNPPFLGDHSRTPEQLADLKQAWGGNTTLSRLDYVTGWHAKALDFYTERTGEFAYVTTNSITQGDQPARLFRPIFDAGWHIKFAHRTFPWTSEAPGKAAVHCVIVGFTRAETAGRLFTYPAGGSDAQEVPVHVGVNAYLVDGSNILVPKRTSPLNADLHEVNKGSMPTDGGHLVVTPDQYDDVVSDPVAAKYLRRFIGSKELLYDLPRWCLWLVDADLRDIARSPILKKRVEAVRAFRAESKAATTRAYGHPHLFRQFGPTYTTPFVAIPEVGSEARRYLPVARVPADTITSNKIYGTADPEGLTFAVLSSTMFLTWQKTVGGRMKSDPSFASTLTWNTFPLPGLTQTQKQRIIAAGRAVETARAAWPDRPLAQHYTSLVMEPALVKAHDALDREVDKAFGATRKLTTERQRLELLFASYANMSQV